jgi:hypothetical protein
MAAITRVSSNHKDLLRAPGFNKIVAEFSGLREKTNYQETKKLSDGNELDTILKKLGESLNEEIKTDCNASIKRANKNYNLSNPLEGYIALKKYSGPLEQYKGHQYLFGYCLFPNADPSEFLIEVNPEGKMVPLGDIVTPPENIENLLDDLEKAPEIAGKPLNLDTQEELNKIFQMSGEKINAKLSELVSKFNPASQEKIQANISLKNYQNHKFLRCRVSIGSDDYVYAYIINSDGKAVSFPDESKEFRSKSKRVLESILDAIEVIVPFEERDGIYDPQKGKFVF